MAIRKKKNLFKKRLGAVADARNKILIVKDNNHENTSPKRPINSAIHSQRNKERRDEPNNKIYNTNDNWLKDYNIQFTYRLKDILLKKRRIANR